MTTAIIVLTAAKVDIKKPNKTETRSRTNLNGHWPCSVSLENECLERVRFRSHARYILKHVITITAKWSIHLVRCDVGCFG